MEECAHLKFLNDLNVMLLLYLVDDGREWIELKLQRDPLFTANSVKLSVWCGDFEFEFKFFGQFINFAVSLFILLSIWSFNEQFG